MSLDIPSPINLKNLDDAKAWELSANIKRPWRYDFFSYYLQNIEQNNNAKLQILELGSGPGFLGKYLLEHLPDIQYTAFDFSEVMHTLALQKLNPNESQRATYLVGDFKQANWQKSLEQFDYIIIHQALHELRHKTYAFDFHQVVMNLLKPKATYFVCDHLFAEDAMQNNELYMSETEHLKVFQDTGFTQVRIPLEIQGLCLFECKV
ncbi:class I SAM-dependent methyltransferase [Acinetobacter guerrae]|uniref:class I SAM-dependent methyltransferase n=1 Tax=Acinetobacter guerrae TaxID=1843371 RepID=UPI00125F6429|nr:class I SAM-dependent methyltransferase [Acinetobacter guerrae]